MNKQEAFNECISGKGNKARTSPQYPILVLCGRSLVWSRTSKWLTCSSLWKPATLTTRVQISATAPQSQFRFRRDAHDSGCKIRFSIRFGLNVADKLVEQKSSSLAEKLAKIGELNYLSLIYDFRNEHSLKKWSIKNPSWNSICLFRFEDLHSA